MTDQSIKQTREKEILMQQGVDSAAMLATLITKLPVLLVLAVAGAVLGSGLHLIITFFQTMEPVYISETEYYIDFADGRYEAKDYYNDFTWNDVLSTDLILGKAMESLGENYDREQIGSMISADILSDVRYLTITVKGGNAELVESVKDALGTAFVEFGQCKEEFDSIEKIEDLGITQEQPQYFALRAALLAACLFAAAGIFVILLKFCRGSEFYTKNDISKVFGIPVYGLTVRNRQKNNRSDALLEHHAARLAENMRMLTDRYPELYLLDASNGDEARAFLQDIKTCDIETDGMKPYCFEKDNKACAILVVIPFGKHYREKITDEINDAKLRDCTIVGAVLTDVDRRWAHIYYGNSKRK